MAKQPRTDADVISQLDKRIRMLENQYLPWQITVGRFGDLVATNLDTGVRSVIAARQIEPQSDAT